MNASADDYARLREERRKRIEEETKAFENEMKRREEEREKRRQERQRAYEAEMKRLADEEEARKKKREEDRRKFLENIKEETRLREEKERQEEEHRRKLREERERKEKAEAEAQRLERERKREERRKQIEEELARQEEERKKKQEDLRRHAEERRRESLQQLASLKKKESLRSLVRSESAKKGLSASAVAAALSDSGKAPPSLIATPDKAKEDAQAERLRKLEEQAALELKADLERKHEADRLAKLEIERLERQRAEAEAAAKKKAEEDAARAKAAAEAEAKAKAEAAKVQMTYEQRLSLTRKHPEVPLPAVERLDIQHVFVLEGDLDNNNEKRPDHDLVKTHFLAEGRVDIPCALKIVETATSILKNEPNCLSLKAPLIVVGDIHGQFFDLCKLLDRSGAIAYNQFLFLGDYVDRGNFSMEVILYLLACKVCFPKQCFLLRGNHETRNLTQHFNFKSECLYKYSQAVYDALMLCFEALPIAAVLEGTEIGKFLAMHGGIGPDIKTVEDLNSKINRFAEPLDYGAFCDVLWSDPFDGDEWCAGWADQAFFSVEFRDNHSRGCGQFYGYAAVTRFLQRNNMKGIIRAHEVKKFGYEEHTFRASDPLVITVFSAPNYCESYENFSAYMRFTDERYTLEQCEFTPQPYYLPNFANVFNYSLPFIFEAVSKFSFSFLQLCEEQDDDAELVVDEKTVHAARDLAAARMKTVGRAMIAAQKQREENQSLLSASLSLRESKDAFRAAREADKQNEKKPPSWQTFRAALQAGAILGRMLDANRRNSLGRAPSPAPSSAPNK